MTYLKEKMKSLDIIYIHGLGSSIATGRKYKELKEIYPNIIGFDWNQSDNLIEKIDPFIDTELNPNKTALIIGSSAGGKVALLMKERIKEKLNSFALTCLINPLTDKKHRLTNIPLTNEYLINGEFHKTNEESLIIYSHEDQVIEQLGSIQEFPNSNSFVRVSDDHSLSNSIDIIIEEIEKYTYSFHGL